MRISKILSILFVVTGTLAQTPPCKLDLSVELTNRTYDGVTYNDGEYFVDNQTGIERGCICLKTTCSRKCCPMGQAYDDSIFKCVNSSVPFNPPVWNDYWMQEGFDALKEFRFFTTHLTCDPGELKILVYPAIDIFHLKTDGTLYLQVQAPGSNVPWEIYGPEKYCIDTFLNVIDLGEDSVILNALVCRAEQEEFHTFELSSSGMLISCFFILLTVAVYFLVPKQRNEPGKVRMVYLLCLFVGFLFMATMQIMLIQETITPNMCTVFTFIIYYSWLAAFFWLNVMCFDVWWTFSGKRGQQSAADKHRRFYKYCAYAFCTPALLTVVLAILEFSPLPYHPMLPNLRKQGCFLHYYGKFIYFYTPIVIVCVANLVFFILTALHIAKSDKEIKTVLESNENSINAQRNKDKQRFKMYVRLFVVMGFNWILEVISAVYPKVTYLWIVTDSYNVLVGLIIFILFVCKKKTLRMIKDRYRQLRGLPASTKPSPKVQVIQMNKIAICNKTSTAKSK